MHELIALISEKAGISTLQASSALDTVKDYVKEKFPMMAGTVDNLFGSGPETAVISTAADTTVVADPAAPVVAEPGILDKISDVIPGETGQKVEDFVKGAAHKAGDVFDDVKHKLGGMFGGDKS